MKKKDLVVLRYRKIDDARTLTQQPSHHGLSLAIALFACALATCDLRACDFELARLQDRKLPAKKCQCH